MKKGGSGLISILRYFCLFVVVAMGTIAIVGLSGCGDGGGGGGGGGGDDDNPLTVTGESGIQVDLDGTWESNCVNDIDDGDSEMASLKVSGSTFTRTGNEWLDDLNCPGTSDITIKIVGTIVLGDEVTVEKNGSDVTATEVDGVFSSYAATCNNADAADELNDENACGFNNWAVGVPKEVLGTDCDPDSDFKDVIYVDDTVDPDAWYEGDDDFLDANGYATELELDSVQYRM